MNIIRKLKLSKLIDIQYTNHELCSIDAINTLLEYHAITHDDKIIHIVTEYSIEHIRDVVNKKHIYFDTPEEFIELIIYLANSKFNLKNYTVHLNTKEYIDELNNKESNEAK